jgi:hypothetical protein
MESIQPRHERVFIMEIYPFDLSDPANMHSNFSIDTLAEMNRPVPTMRVNVEFSRGVDIGDSYWDWNDAFTKPTASKIHIPITSSNIRADEDIVIKLGMRKRIGNITFNQSKPPIDRIGVIRIPLALLIESKDIMEGRFLGPTSHPTNFKFRLLPDSQNDSGPLPIANEIVQSAFTRIEKLKNNIEQRQNAGRTTSKFVRDQLDKMNGALEYNRGENVIGEFSSDGADGNNWINVFNHQPLRLHPQFLSSRLKVSCDRHGHSVDWFEKEVDFVEAIEKKIQNKFGPFKTRADVETAVSMFLSSNEAAFNRLDKHLKVVTSISMTYVKMNDNTTYISDFALVAFIDKDRKEKTMWVPCEKEDLAIVNRMNDCEGKASIVTNLAHSISNVPQDVAMQAGSGFLCLKKVLEWRLFGVTFCVASTGRVSAEKDMLKTTKLRNALHSPQKLHTLTAEQLNNGDNAGHAMGLAMLSSTPVFDVSIDEVTQNVRIDRSAPQRNGVPTVMEVLLERFTHSARFIEMTAKCSTSFDSERAKAAGEFRDLIASINRHVAKQQDAESFNKLRLAVKNMHPLNKTNVGVLPAVDSRDPEYHKQNIFVSRVGVMFLGNYHCMIGTVDAQTETDFKASATSGEVFNMDPQRRVAIARLVPKVPVTRVQLGAEDIINHKMIDIMGSTRRAPPIPSWIQKWCNQVNGNGVNPKAEFKEKATSTMMYPDYVFVTDKNTIANAQWFMTKIGPHISAASVHMDPVCNDDFVLRINIELKSPSPEVGLVVPEVASQSPILQSKVVKGVRNKRASKKDVVPNQQDQSLLKHAQERERVRLEVFARLEKFFVDV